MSILLDHAARRLMQVFDGCLLIPVRPGVAPDAVPTPLAAEANTAAYQARLATSSVAIVLGARSGGLLTIRFDGEAELTAFLERNPGSRTTLITSHGGRPTIWHRAEVAHRASLHLRGMVVLLSGNVLVRDRCDLGRADVILHSAPPSLVDLETMDWGTDSAGDVDVWLTRLRHGGLFRPGRRGELVPNRAVWQNFLSLRLRRCYVYETSDGRFYARTAAGDWRPVAEDVIRSHLQEIVLTAPVATAAAKAAISDLWLDRLVGRMRWLLPAGPPILLARLREFAHDCLTVKRGSDVTVTELYESFAAFCRDQELPVIPETVFQKLILNVLRADPWYRPKSKSIARPSGCQNGFRSLGLRNAGQVTRKPQILVHNGALGAAR